MSSFSLVDIGNTTIKVRKSFADYEKSVSIPYNDGWIEKVVKNLSSLPNSKIVYSSSNQKILEKLKELEIITEDSVRGVSLIEGENKKFEDELDHKLLDFAGVDGIGHDRMISLFGAVQHGIKKWAYPSIIAVFSFGTATTLTLGQKSGVAGYKCLGGAIFPGLQSQKDEIKRILPFSTIDSHWYASKKSVFGKNTNDAIAYGIFEAPFKGIFEDIKKLSESIAVYVTGGYSDMMIPLFKDNFNMLTHQKELLMDTMGYLTSSQLRQHITEW